MAGEATPAERQIIQALLTVAEAIESRDYDRAKTILAANTLVVLGDIRLLEHVRRWYRHMHLEHSRTDAEKALRLATLYLFESAVVATFAGLAVNHTDRNYTRTAPSFGRVYSLTFSDALDEGSVVEGALRPIHERSSLDTGVEPVEQFYRLARQERLLRIARFLASGPHNVVARPAPVAATRLSIFPRVRGPRPT
jgi:hypothetical protein